MTRYQALRDLKERKARARFSPGKKAGSISAGPLRSLSENFSLSVHPAQLLSHAEFRVDRGLFLGWAAIPGKSAQCRGECSMRIALDAMGGDYAPKNTIEGAVLALKEYPYIGASQDPSSPPAATKG